MFQFRTFSGLTEGTLSVCQGSPHGEISLEDASPRRVSAPPRQSYTHTGCTFRPTSSTRIAKCLRRLKSDPSLRNLREWNSNPKFPKNHRARSEPRLFNPSSHSENTQPEMVVRRFLHRLGYRYVLHQRNLPDAPDLVFPSRRKVIFVHGCFWHQHRKCVDGRVPKSRVDYWAPKLSRNVARDRKHVRQLQRDGWRVAKVWECETIRIKKLERRLIRFLR
jgi:DNA mismatch endonuclease (patch repair protein)